MKSALQKIFSALDDMRGSMIEAQRELTAIPALAPESGGDGEEKKTAILEQKIRALGITAIERADASDNRVSSGRRPNLIVSREGGIPGENLLIMTHTDIVPPGDTVAWATDPYTLAEKDGLLYGRGTEDNQQSLVASLFALAALQQTGLVPRATVRLLFVADEETGSEFGIKHVLKTRPDLFTGKISVVVPDAGRPDGSMIEIAEKNILWLKICTKGKQVHASTPQDGINAFVAASDMVLRLHALHERYPQQNALFDPPVSTFSPTKKEANVPNVNTIPGDDVFYLDCRILPETGADEIITRVQVITREIEIKYGVTVSIEIVQKEASPATRESAPIIGTLAAAIKTVYGVEAKPAGIGGGTVAAHLRRAGIDTVVWSTIDHTAHMPNEYCRIDNMVRDAKVMARLMLGRD